MKKSCDRFEPYSNFILIDKFDLEELKLCAWSLRVIEFFDEYKEIIEKIKEQQSKNKLLTKRENNL